MGAEVAKVERADLGRDQKPAENAGSVSMAPKRKEPAPKTPKRKPWGTKAKAIIEIKQKHPTLTSREVGELVKCDHSHVVKVLARWGIEQSKNEEYKENRADILAGVGRKILATITDADIKKASLNQKVVSYGILYDKERLERGESTENIAALHADIAAIRAIKGGRKC